MNKLDTLVRRSMLAYPLIFPDRWHVLRHLYLVIGNGHEWHEGEIIDKFAVDRPEDELRAEFFEDIEELEQITGRRHDLDRARRQFQLDHLDALATEQRCTGYEQLTILDITGGAQRYSLAFTVPDQVEDSFLLGAIETVETLAFGLHFAAAAGWNTELYDAALRQRTHLRDRRDTL